MRIKLGIAVATLAFSCGAAAAGMSKEDYQAAKQRIAKEYEQERQKCGPRHGNDLQLCVARAHGTRDVAKAELEAAYKPSARTNYDAAAARAQNAYAVAKQECDNQRDSNTRKVCVKEAKAALARARSEAAAARKAAGG